MDFPTLLPTVRPNSSLVTYGGLGQWASVVAAGLTAGVALTTTYFGWRQQSDAQKRERHASEREAARAAEAAAAQQAAAVAAQQAAAVQNAVSVSSGVPGGMPRSAAGVAGMLGSPMVLAVGAGLAIVLALTLGRRR